MFKYYMQTEGAIYFNVERISLGNGEYEIRCYWGVVFIYSNQTLSKGGVFYIEKYIHLQNDMHLLKCLTFGVHINSRCFFASRASVFRNTKNSVALNRLKPTIKRGLR